jgi:RNA polymerase sigma-70 factor (ECF subfamily)
MCCPASILSPRTKTDWQKGVKNMKNAGKADEELMLLFQKGDAGAFELLFKKYKMPIYSFILRQCSQKETAADLTQDVFVKFIKNAQSFNHKSKFSTWIYTIARNTVIDNLRKAKHRHHISFDQPAEKEGSMPEEKIPSSSPLPDAKTAAARLQSILINAIDKLPADQKEVFLLREYQGLPFQEISKVVNAKTGTVKSRMRYALEFLKKELSKQELSARSLS